MADSLRKQCGKRWEALKSERSSWKAWRRGRTGLDLLGCAKAVAAKEGAPGFTFMAPPGSAFDKLCDRLGMTHTHNCYWCKCDE